MGVGSGEVQPTLGGGDALLKQRPAGDVGRGHAGVARGADADHARVLGGGRQILADDERVRPEVRVEVEDARVRCERKTTTWFFVVVFSQTSKSKNFNL